MAFADPPNASVNPTPQVYILQTILAMAHLSRHGLWGESRGIGGSSQANGKKMARFSRSEPKKGAGLEVGPHPGCHLNFGCANVADAEIYSSMLADYFCKVFKSRSDPCRPRGSSVRGPAALHVRDIWAMLGSGGVVSVISEAQLHVH